MDRAQSISDSELKIMRVLWEHQGQIMLAPLMETLGAQGYHWKATTILTFLARLSDKGMVRVKKIGRLNQYIALVTQDEYTASQTNTFVREVYGGDTKGLIASLLQAGGLSPTELDELRIFWEEAKGSG